MELGVYFYIFIPLDFYRFTIKSLMQFYYTAKLINIFKDKNKKEKISIIKLIIAIVSQLRRDISKLVIVGNEASCRHVRQTAVT